MNDVALADAPLRAAPRGGLAGSTAVVVLGMHRSGTSALTGMLAWLGVVLGDHLMPAAPDNPRGYWENLDIVAANQALIAELGRGWDDIRPLPPGYEDSAAGHAARHRLSAILRRDFAGAALWGVKDPRLCRLAALWDRVLEESCAAPRFILMLRHPLEVAASLAGRDGFSTERGLLLWLRHVLEAERGTRGRPRAIVHYEELVGRPGWREVAGRIARAIGVAWPQAGSEVEAAIDSYLAPELRHFQAGELDEGNGAAERMQGWIAAVYAAFAPHREEAERRAACEAVSRELEAADRLFVPILGEARGERAGMGTILLSPN